MSVFEELNILLEDPYIRAKEEKERGGKVVGITPMHFPGELVHAGGIFPVLLQETNEPITTGWAHIFPNFCAFTRSNVDWAVKGNLYFLDAVIISDICLQTRIAFGIMSRRMNIPFIYMWWPLEYSLERWRAPVLKRLHRCKEALEQLIGKPITDQDIRKSIEVYNRNRRLLREIYELRRRKPGILRAREMLTLVLSSMVIPKEQHSDLLAKLISELEKASPVVEGKAKVFLSGHLCHGVRPDILDLIEELGAVVVGDDLYVGYRYFAAEVPTDTSPLEALMSRYFNLGVPCPTRCGAGGDWADHIIKATRESQAQGVIFMIPKFCEAHMFYYPYLKDRLIDAGIPHIFVETEHEVISLGGTRTRVQAFIEAIKG